MIMTSIYYCSNLVVVYANVTTNHAINVPILIANILGIPTNIIIIIITATA